MRMIPHRPTIKKETIKPATTHQTHHQTPESAQYWSTLPNHIETGIIDLTAETVINMLKEANEYQDIVKATSLNDAHLSNHAEEVLDAFKNTAPSVKSIRRVLPTYGNPADFNMIEHADFGFIEMKIRHFLDLIESPKNPLIGSLHERTTAVYTNTFLLDQLFLSYNDVLELDDCGLSEFQYPFLELD